jgi:hypothetical protein
MQAQRLGMMTFTELASVLAGRPLVFTEQLRLALVAYLAPCRGSSREHANSDLRCYLS